MTVEEAAVGYDDQILSEPINLDIRKMNAVAIVGPNGIGKSTLIKSIVGQIPFIKGEARFGANVEVGYYDQTQSKLTPHNSVLDELWNDFKLTPEVEIRNRLGSLPFLRRRCQENRRHAVGWRAGASTLGQAVHGKQQFLDSR